MKPGELDRRVALQSYSVSRDSWGHPEKTWSTYASVWAKKTDLTEYESNEQSQQVAINRTTFRVRYRSDIKATHRVLYDSRYYDIIGIKELGRKEGLVLTTQLRD